MPVAKEFTTSILSFHFCIDLLLKGLIPEWQNIGLATAGPAGPTYSDAPVFVLCGREKKLPEANEWQKNHCGAVEKS